MKALIRARLEVIEEKQSACVTKLNTLSGVYPGIDDMLPVKMSARHDAGGLLKFPVAKTVARNAPKKERASGFFGGLPRK